MDLQQEYNPITGEFNLVNQDASNTIIKDDFEGDGVTVDFIATTTLDSNYMVYMDGILMQNGVSRIGNTVTFDVAPPDGSKISIVN